MGKANGLNEECDQNIIVHFEAGFPLPACAVEGRNDLRVRMTAGVTRGREEKQMTLILNQQIILFCLVPCVSISKIHTIGNNKNAIKKSAKELIQQSRLLRSPKCHHIQECLIEIRTIALTVEIHKICFTSPSNCSRLKDGLDYRVHSGSLPKSLSLSSRLIRGLVEMTLLSGVSMLSASTYRNPSTTFILCSSYPGG